MEPTMVCELTESGVKCGSILFQNSSTSLLMFLGGIFIGIWLFLVIYAISKLLDEYDIKFVKIVSDKNDKTKSSKV